MALVQLTSNTEARRLQNNGYSRTGNKSVETDLENLKDLVQEKEHRIKKVVLHRNNGEQEAEIIDHLIDKEMEGDHKEIYRWYARSSGTGIEYRTNNVFRVDEDKMKLHDYFKEVILNYKKFFEGRKTVEVNLKDSDDFESAKEEAIKDCKEQIQELEEKKQELEETTEQQEIKENFY